MRRLFFAGHNADLHALQLRRFKPALQVTFAEAKPTIAVELVRFLEFVLQQIEDHQLPAWHEQPLGRLQRLDCRSC